jgi:hypothetical protein
VTAVPMRIVFVMSPYQNAFFDELADALGRALDDVGVERCRTTSPGDHVVRESDVFVLLPPHEYATLEGDAFFVDEVVAQRTIGISAEQPHQGFFERNAAVGVRLGAVLDFSRHAVTAYRRLGVDARHLSFGLVPSWDRVAGTTDPRPIETPVLYLANNRTRRLTTLAAAADALSGADARLVMSDPSEPNRVGDASFFTGEAKRDLLSATGLVINIHQSDEPYFEWLRFTEAVHCGAPVLTEVSTNTEPFSDGVHFLSFERSNLSGALAAATLDPDRLVDIASAAYRRLAEHPLARSVLTLVDAAEELLAHPPPTSLPSRVRSLPIGRNRRAEVAQHRISHQQRKPLIAWRRSGKSSGSVLVAPDGTSWRTPPNELAEQAGGSSLVSVMCSGVDADGEPALEGLWPWEPWRLVHGQHLGRALIVEKSLLRAAERWLVDPMFEAFPHLRIQVYAATHGIEGAHIACPHVTLAVPVDPTHRINDAVARRCAELLV